MILFSELLINFKKEGLTLLFLLERGFGLNLLEELCMKIKNSFEMNNIDEGYSFIIMFSDELDLLCAHGYVNQKLKNEIQIQLILLQRLLNDYEDILVAEHFEFQILPLVSQINPIN